MSAAFIPAATPKQAVIKKSLRYRGTEADYQNIKALFESLLWMGVETVYITNGWHEGFEGGYMRTYCDYCLHTDDSTKYHYYWDEMPYEAQHLYQMIVFGSLQKKEGASKDLKDNKDDKKS
ncbi:MAG TPA: hypothetical protein VGB73_00180 [Pyrinomonadaceae bacterium]